MAIELAQAYVSIIPSARGIQASLRRELAPLEHEADAVGDRSARKFGNRFVAGMGVAASRGAVALAAGFTLAAGAGIKIAADFEQTQIAFEGILGSADAANDVLGDLRDFAAKTPFEFTGLTDSAKTLLGVGFAAEDIIPTMATLGNVAATLGVGEAEIKGVVRALGQIKGKGKASAEELQQISEQIPGFSAINAIADELGVTTAEAFKLMEKGAIPADDAIEAILGGMESFPGAAGAMERQSKTLNGVISTFKDTLATTAIDFITPYLPAISSGVAAFGGFISQTLVPGIESLLNLFDEEGLGGIFSRLGDLIATNAPILGAKLLVLGAELVEWIQPQVGPMLGELLNLINAAGTWFLEDGLPALMEGTLVLAGALASWITDPEDGAIVSLIEALPGFAEALTDWITTEMAPAAGEAAKEIGVGIVVGIFSGMRDALKLPAGAKLKIPGTDIELDIPEELRRARGGPVSAGVPYLVGDRHGLQSAELFVPDVSGTILPEVPTGLGGPLIGALSVVQMPGEDAGSTVMRELRRYQALAS